jgi:antitoxin (DNA-binding transcriptional repressor) of toxin-antitoxin stability system
MKHGAAKIINASDFKARCLKILDELEPEGVVILKRGKPVARVVPLTNTNVLQLVGSLKKKIKIKGDIFSTGEKWNAES